MSELEMFRKRAWSGIQADREQEERAKMREAVKQQAAGALARASEGVDRFPGIGGGLRFLLGALLWVFWAHVLGITFGIIGHIIGGDEGANNGGVFGVAVSLVITWASPEIFHYVTQGIAVMRRRHLALAEYRRLRTMLDADDERPA